MHTTFRRLVPGLIVAACLPLATARNIDLSTVPHRDTVQLTIYNSEDLTLVRETRVLTFKQGVNPLQFSWANTLIDPTSVELTFRTQPDQLTVLDTTFPHDKPQMLYWNVQSDFDGEATVEISYFTSGISWSADYVCLANADETQMHLDGFVRIVNRSGEQYENAQIRLVVGTINLVEKIAQLAQIPMDKVDQLREAVRSELRLRAARGIMKPASQAEYGSADEAGRLDEAKIIKEGLSEYFIYTIEGTQTIPDGWAKRMRSFEGEAVPFRIQYRYRPQEYGDQLVRMYLLTNDTPSELGTTPLPDGVVRVFRDNGRDGLSFLVAQTIKYVPIGDKIELNLGPDPEVIFELIKLRAFRDNLWLHIHGTDLFRRADDGAFQIDVNSTVAGWDDHEIYTQRIRNYTAKPIAVEIRRTLPGHVVFRSALQAKLHDYQTVELRTAVEPAKRADLLFEVVRHQGRNATQHNVTLEDAAVQP
ncbi:MAG: hypothetical protein KA383_08485 [Phycisphaerae bacterium]|nr:hypothetical protein [Phycisphaerae bacterium]